MFCSKKTGTWIDVKKKMKKEWKPESENRQWRYNCFFLILLWIFGFCVGFFLDNRYLTGVLFFSLTLLWSGLIKKQRYRKQRKRRIAFLKSGAKKIDMLEQKDSMRIMFCCLVRLRQRMAIPSDAEGKLNKYWIEVLWTQEKYERKLKQMIHRLCIVFFFWTAFLFGYFGLNSEWHSFFHTGLGKQGLAIHIGWFLLSVSIALHGYRYLEYKR